MKNLILNAIDFFYPLFRKFMPMQTFRYAACGGGNTLLDIFLFNKFQHSFAKIGVIHFASFAMKPHTAALVAAFCITFPIGFLS